MRRIISTVIVGLLLAISANAQDLASNTVYIRPGWIVHTCTESGDI